MRKKCDKKYNFAEIITSIEIEVIFESRNIPKR